MKSLDIILLSARFISTEVQASQAPGKWGSSSSGIRPEVRDEPRSRIGYTKFDLDDYSTCIYDLDRS